MAFISSFPCPLPSAHRPNPSLKSEVEERVEREEGKGACPSSFLFHVLINDLILLIERSALASQKLAGDRGTV